MSTPSRSELADVGQPPAKLARVSGTGVVIIGRNEGSRLVRCIESVMRDTPHAVYVDSGSSDGSVEAAGALQVAVAELDRSLPFSASRARNEGVRVLLERQPDTVYVQFVDGDCELQPGWLDAAARELDAHPDVAVVCGRLRERHPDQTVYNRICDIEWNQPPGATTASGGIAMMRLSAFSAAGGFDPNVVAAEDDEICCRIRAQGGRVVRLSAEMALHDAAMTRLSQWWRRAARSGHAYAQLTAMHGRDAMRHWRPMIRSILFWGAALPAAAVLLAWPTRGWSLVLFLGHPVLGWRIHARKRREGIPSRHAFLYALSCVGMKLPQALGVALFWFRRFSGRPMTIIEHKKPGNAR